MIREETEAREQETLSPQAQRSALSRGRQRPQEKCSVRTEFQRDRDRIIHCKAFRRLKDKTQVFVAPAGDHFRTRLTHTLEVSQIARTIARALRLNEDLTEAIALGHDLGHTPFGHAGEEILNEIHPGGFRHNEQSARVVEVLEGDGGLNLTWEVRDGIRHHTGPEQPASLEGQVVRLSDRIAYVNHDLDDALRGEVLRSADLPARSMEVLGLRSSERINTLVLATILASQGVAEIRMAPEAWAAMDQLRDFLFDRVYIGSAAKREEEKAKGIVGSLYHHYLTQPEFANAGGATAVVDYLAGMTDRFAVHQFLKLYVPAPWRREED